MKGKLINMLIDNFEEDFKNTKSYFNYLVIVDKFKDFRNKLPSNLVNEFKELDDMLSTSEYMKFEEFVYYVFNFIKQIFA